MLLATGPGNGACCRFRGSISGNLGMKTLKLP